MDKGLDQKPDKEPPAEKVDAGSASSKETSPSRLNGALAVLSNGFVLLIMGSLITAFLVPMYQQHTGARQTQLKLMEEAHRDFLQYENSIWEEYYAIFPLLHERSISKETYIEYTRELTDLKLGRYRLYATLRSLAVAFEPATADLGGDKPARSEVERAVENYAVRINSLSAKIAEFVGSLYCGDTECWSADYSYRTQGDRLELFNEITREMQDTVALGEKVAAAMVRQIKER